MNEKGIRAGWFAGVFGSWLLVYFVGNVSLLAYQITLFADKMHSPNPAVLLATNIASWASTLITLGMSVAMSLRASRMLPGTRGRTRLLLGSRSLILHAVNVYALSIPFLGPPLLSVALGMIAPSDFLMRGMTEIEPWVSYLSVTLVVIHALLGVVVLACLFSYWFLLTARARKFIWVGVDVLVFAAFAYCLHAFRMDPRVGHPLELRGAVIRLLVTVVFVIRVLAHVMPLLLDLVESANVRTMIAARMLRAGKSGFLTTIGLLSILAVSVASAAPSIVLSIMGGFRADLKRKILGNNAHIVIDRDHGNFQDWAELLARTRAVPGVTGAAPYVAGEVMISSSSNLSGAVLHGIDPDLINEVTDLSRNLRQGRMSYLVHPEGLLHLSPQEISSAPMPLTDAMLQRQRVYAETEVPVADGGVPRDGATPVNPRGSVVRDLDQLMRGDTSGSTPVIADDPADDGLEQFLLPARDRAQPREVLPGIIIGQELAHTLRLFLGDEVNVVSPFGGLGPAGPIPKSRTFRVAGIFYSGMYEYDMKFIYMMLPVAQEFLSTGNAISGIEVKVADMEHAPEARALIERTLHRNDLRVRDWKELNRNLFGALALEKLAMFLALGIAIVVAGFCVFGTLTLMVQEKSKQVGVLKAMGTSPNAIVSVFLTEGLLIGFIGAALGLGVGYVACFAFEHFGVAMNPEVYYIDRLPISIDPLEFTLVAVSSVAVCLLATIFPAILASRISPIQALRQD